MVIPLYVVLLVFIFILALIGFFFIASIYHLVSTGTFTASARVVTTLVTLLSVVVLVAAVVLLWDVEWGRQVTLFGEPSISYGS